MWIRRRSCSELSAFDPPTNEASLRREIISFMLILGLNMFHADASAAIVQDGEVIFAIAEERLNRHKHFGGFPSLSVQACLDAVGAKISEVDHVAVGQDSNAHLARKIQYAAENPAKIFNLIRMRQRKEGMRDVRSLLAKALTSIPRGCIFRSTISNITSRTSPALTTVLRGKRRPASVTTDRAILCRP